MQSPFPVPRPLPISLQHTFWREVEATELPIFFQHVSKLLWLLWTMTAMTLGERVPNRNGGQNHPAPSLPARHSAKGCTPPTSMHATTLPRTQQMPVSLPTAVLTR